MSKTPNKLTKGEKVVMHTCGEAEHYKGHIWECSSNSWNNGHSELVFLKGFSGNFITKYLQVVDIKSAIAQDWINKTIIHLRDYLPEGEGAEEDELLQFFDDGQSPREAAQSYMQL